ncbi:MAG: hypothetical protein RLZZ271_240 [Pseudomonadota bacterium]|jgi:hypothetical protein
MKFEFKNLGAIDQAEVELAPLTLICGRNNTGKTYVTYAIYALLATWRGLIDWKIDVVDMDKLLSHGAVSIDMQAKFVNQWDEARQMVGKRWKAYLPHALAAPLSRFHNTELTFHLDIGDEWRRNVFKKEFRSEKGRILYSVEKAENSTIVELVAIKDEDGDGLPIYALEDFIAQALLESVLQIYLPTVFMVSTERTGAVAFKEELNLTKNKLVNFLTKMDANKDSGQTIHPGHLFDAVYKQGYPLPVEKNVEFVNRLASLEGRTGPLLAQHPELSSRFEAIAGGRYETNKDGITHFVPKGSNTKLQLSEASSAARSLVVFWYWLKAQASAGQMLLMDEPELNLHPENQRALARLLAKLVQLGVQVLITTHSDTMLREFNTLIMLARDLPHMAAVRERFGYAADDGLAPERVRLYVANGKPKTATGRAKKNAVSTLECIKPDARLGLTAEIFDQTITEMNDIQDALRYGGV